MGCENVEEAAQHVPDRNRLALTETEPEARIAPHLVTAGKMIRRRDCHQPPPDRLGPLPDLDPGARRNG